MAGVGAIAAFIMLNLILFTCVSSSYIPCPPKTTPSVHPKPPAAKVGKCPRDTLKFGVCGDWLGLLHEVVGVAPSTKCCTVIEGLADLEVALCLCTAIKGQVLGVIKYDIPVAVSLIVNSCGKKVPKGFVCP